VSAVLLRLGVATLTWLAIVAGQPASGGLPLRVCLQSDDPPLSFSEAGKPLGFDVDLAGLIAARLDRPLEIQWFTTRDDPDSNPMTEADALLSDGHCVLVAGYPLVADKLGRPRAARGKLPPFAGAKPEDRRRWIDLGELAATRPYRFDAITVALAPAHSRDVVHVLADLRNLSIGVRIHGLPDLIAMSYHRGALAQQVVHVSQDGMLFSRLEHGDIDAALVDQRELDAWHLAHPETHVASTGYRHSVGFNIGLVGLAANSALIEAVDKVLDELLAEGRLPEMARANAMTYLPPRMPEVSPGLDPNSIYGD
jgi:ABC-type amino acid transport substrate-binding protein